MNPLAVPLLGEFGSVEIQARRQGITNELLDAIAESGLPNEVRTINQKCYRKRFLVPLNPRSQPQFFSGRRRDALIDKSAIFTGE